MSAKYGFFGAIVLLVIAILTACQSDGDKGEIGSSGQNSIVSQENLFAGNSQCFKGGTKINSGLDANNNGVLDTIEVESVTYVCNQSSLNEQQNFNRISTFPVCLQFEASCNTDVVTAAEIVAANHDGTVLVYTDSPGNRVGFVDISNTENPTALGTVALDGEPTSVAIKGNYALVAVNTSTDFVNVAGQLDVFDISTRVRITSINLGGQPDSIAVSPDGQYAAIAIENERDEDLGNGAPPQLPAGALIVVDITDANPVNWTTATIALTDIADLYGSDPEPEYVDINSNNIAVVTMQENNHIVLVNLTDASIVNHFSAGSVDLMKIDASEGSPLQIRQTESQSDVLREPDGVAWINNDYFATANEGDLNGGSRGFTIFNLTGDVVWDSGSTLDHLAAQLGHYPDKRSGNKGNEPENIELGIYGSDRYLFVNSERSNLVFVYDVADPKYPLLKQILPAAVAPEGGLAIPARNLLVVASEKDNRGDKIRSAINLYHYDYENQNYPTLVSAGNSQGAPIPWGALSGLSADIQDSEILYSVEDSFYGSSRIFKINAAQTPARIIDEIMIKDTNGVLASFPAALIADSNTPATDATRKDIFDSLDLAAMINADSSVNIDSEGIAKAADGGFWIASEGNGTVGDVIRPVNSLNFIFKTDVNGVIENVYSLPTSVNDIQLRFGYEGIAEDEGLVYVAFQRAWGTDANPRIGIFNPVSETWQFVFYPLDVVASQNSGWVGLSDMTSLGNGKFLMLERDNQGGPDAAIKRLYQIDLSTFVADSVISKTLVRDLMTDIRKSGGLAAEKIEGAAVTADGQVFIVNDNDGVDDNSGETQLINLGKILN